MACILKLPSADSKGVITFTTQERDRFILYSKPLQEKILALKKEWVIGLHHNWHDYKFRYNPLFDFSMAGEEDLKEVSGVPFPLVPLDACNFVPEVFKPAEGEKFWDILYVARAVKFKKIPEFFECVRRLYDSGKRYRVLFICPIPPYKRSERKTVFYDIRRVYDSMFSEEEKDLFTLLTIDYRYPFPFDMPTLAQFYRSSKVFVHFADDERRCRVAAYAWASGMPVVGMSPVGSLLPSELRKEPYFYAVGNYIDFDHATPKAIENFDHARAEGRASQFFNLRSMQERLIGELKKVFAEKGLSYGSGAEFLSDLDIRLGRHILPAQHKNSIDMPFTDFIDLLQSKQDDLDRVAQKTIDPEQILEEEYQTQNPSEPFIGIVRRIIRKYISFGL